MPMLPIGDRHQPSRYAFVDLETTGTDASRDRITEIGIVWMKDGIRTGEWSSLLNPGVAIPPEIQALTGIDNAMVRNAPDFSEVADQLREMLTGHVFVAHNARFDYGFIKAAFRRIGQRFQADVLCTVRLSRKMFPQYSRHGLDALIARHHLAGRERHRALGDAQFIADFFQDLTKQAGARQLAEALEHLLKYPARPAHLPEGVLEDLPESPGVYTFLGINRQPLYIGKARNLRDRVRSHFYADSSNGTDARLANEAHDLEIEETAGEFCALVREIQLIRACAPLHNLALRRREATCFIRMRESGQTPAYLPLAEFRPTEASGLYGPFSSRQSARAALSAIAREHRLCDRAIGLWTGDRACFSRQVGRCLGLCCGEEAPERHHQRFLAAIAPLQFPTWPFNGAVRLTETNPESRLSQTLRFDNWCAIDETQLAEPAFDVEVFKLLRRRLAREAGGLRGQADRKTFRLSDALDSGLP